MYKNDSFYQYQRRMIQVPHGSSLIQLLECWCHFHELKTWAQSTFAPAPLLRQAQASVWRPYRGQRSKQQCLEGPGRIPSPSPCSRHLSSSCGQQGSPTVSRGLSAQGWPDLLLGHPAFNFRNLILWTDINQTLLLGRALPIDEWHEVRRQWQALLHKHLFTLQGPRQLET